MCRTECWVLGQVLCQSTWRRRVRVLSSLEVNNDKDRPVRHSSMSGTVHCCVFRFVRNHLQAFYAKRF